MSNLFWVFLVALGITSCGGIVRPVQSSPEAAKGVTSSPNELGILVSQKKLFLMKPRYVSPSTTEFEPAEENTLEYRFTTADLEPLSEPAYTVEISYDMPGMPGMGGPWKPKVSALTNGVIQATFEIPHGGLDPDSKWVFTWRISKSGTVIDTLQQELWIKS